MNNQSFLDTCTGNNISIPTECSFVPKPSFSYTVTFFPEQRQLRITPFPFEEWTDLWRIELTLKDDIGLLNDIVDVIQELSLNILSEVTRVSKSTSQKLYHAEFVVSADGYTSPQGINTLDRRGTLNCSLEFVETILLANFIDGVQMTKVQRGVHGKQYEPDLKVERMRKYYNLYDEFRKLSQIDQHRIVLKPPFKLPPRWYTKLLKVTGHNDTKENKQPNEPEMTYITSTNAHNLEDWR